MAITEKYCPDCGSRLYSISLISTKEFPNEYRVFAYTCPSCNKKCNRTKMFFLFSVILKDHATLGKFRASREYSEKLNKLVLQLNDYDPVLDKRARIQYCMLCKEPLNYDSMASITRNPNQIQIRSYFHSECKSSENQTVIFTFVRGIKENVEFVRIAQG